MSRYLSQSGGLVLLSHRYTGAEQPLSLPISSDYKSEVSGGLWVNCSIYNGDITR